jgi:hypothetical protein
MTTPEPCEYGQLLASYAADLSLAYPGSARLYTLTRMAFLIEENIPGEVATMRKRHASWEDVGNALGMSRQAAQKRFGP